MWPGVRTDTPTTPDLLPHPTHHTRPAGASVVLVRSVRTNPGLAVINVTPGTAA